MVVVEFSKHDVTFEVDGTPVAGTLYRPAEPARRGLVFLGPLTSVKEQVPGNYAAAMAARGFLSLAIDNRHFGESGGAPREYEVPARKAEDIRAAAAYLLASDEVDRVGAVGICAGAGYLCPAVAEDDSLRAFATVAGFFHDAAQQREWMGGGFDAAVERAKGAREHFETSGECEYIPAVGEEGGMFL